MGRGLRVRRITIRTGTKKMRSSVSPFGRFIRAQRWRRAPERREGCRPETAVNHRFQSRNFTIDSGHAGVNVTNGLGDTRRSAKTPVTTEYLGG